ncbi:hypothetical protein [Pseudidiomarina marina]|uniref:Lipoprotein n=1 Tax=Pseudidiomarina marina TaxID=502366 RepID=A0A432YG97_9GAMM|nr:hypothetical protein [Pseudidiomarina marina]RUO59964.1 hypothetical protein CWI76_07515 [Pseudidiomarina marina]
MRHKLILLAGLSALFFIAGCAVPIVYLNDYELEESNFEKVKNALEEKGFKVNRVSLKPPSNIHESTIITGSKATVEQNYNQIMPILASLGYSNTDITFVESGNHWYRGDNIGVYLFDDGVGEKPEREIIGEYSSDNCESMKSLILKADGNFNVAYTFGGELSGEWQIISMPYVNLWNKRTGLNFYYQIEIEEQSDFSGKVDVITLVPLDDQSQIRDCIFYKGIRKGKAI